MDDVLKRRRGDYLPASFLRRFGWRDRCDSHTAILSYPGLTNSPLMHP